MSEYLKHEHDHIERSDEKLQEQLAVLSLSKEYGIGPRREQIEREMSMIAFELSERLRERKNEEIEQAWAGREEILERINTV